MNEGRRQSVVTGVFQAIRRTLDTEQKGDLLEEAGRQRLLRMCYLWPLTCCGVFLPLLVYLQFRQDPEVALHARHGVVISAFYTVVASIIGLVHGIAGRLVVDWLNVSLVCSIVLAVLVIALVVSGLRWYRLAIQGEPVEIPLITGLAERL